MRKLALCWTLPLLLTGFLSGVAWAAPSDGGLQIELEKQVAKGKAFLVDLGYQAENTPVTLSIGIRNTRPYRLQLDAFKFGDNLDVRWATTNDLHKLETRSTLAPGELRELTVRLMPAQSAEFPYLVLFSKKLPISTIAIGYMLAPKVYTVDTGGDYWSGLPDSPNNTDGWSPRYELCAGPAPFQYHIDPKATHVDAHTVEGQHGRSCSGWMHCIPERVDDTDVCYGIEIQGHLKRASFFGGWDDEKEFVKVNVRLRARYNLAPSTPLLSAVRLKSSQH
jgi:hypothetical protein